LETVVWDDRTFLMFVRFIRTFVGLSFDEDFVRKAFPLLFRVARKWLKAPFEGAPARSARIWNLFANVNLPISVAEEFLTFCERKGMASRFLAQPTDVVLALRPILRWLSERYLIAGGPLPAFWATVSSSGDSSMFELFGELVANVEESDFLSVFAAVEDPAFVGHALSWRLRRADQSAELLSGTIELLFVRAEKAGVAVLAPLFHSDLHAQLRAFVLAQARALLSQGYSECAVHALLQCCESESGDLTDADAQTVAGFLTVGNRPSILRVVRLFVSSGIWAIGEPFLRELLTSAPGEAWPFLAECLRTRPSGALSPAAFELLQAFVDSFNAPSEAFVDFLTIFLGPMRPLEQRLVGLLLNGDAPLASAARDGLVHAYARDEPESAVGHLLEVFDGAESGAGGARVLDLILSYCAQAESGSACVDRHCGDFPVLGVVPVSVRCDDCGGEEALLSVADGTPACAVVAGVSAFLAGPPALYGLVDSSGAAVLSIPVGGGCFSTARVEGRPLFASEHFSARGLVVELLKRLRAPHTDEFSVLCARALAFMPTDPGLAALSADAPAFWAALESAQAPGELRYLLEVLSWRTSSAFFAARFAALRPFPLLVRVLSDPAGPQVCGDVAAFLEAVHEPAAAALAEPLLALLGQTAAPERSRVAIARYLRRCSDASAASLLTNARLEALLPGLPPSVWADFCPFLCGIGDAQSLWELGFAHLRERDAPQFADLFRYFLRVLRSEQPPREAFARELRLLRADFFELVTFNLAQALSDGRADFAREPELLSELIGTIRPALPDAVVIDILALAKDFAALAEPHAAILAAFVDRLTSASIARWSAVPAQLRTAPAAGLRNLGATCYLNAVLQAVLRIPAFCARLFAAAPGPTELNVLAHALHFSTAPWVDPADFCRAWPAWGGAAIDTHQQQDANEFLQLFLDRLPPQVTELFGGEVVHEIEGYSIIPERFVSLGLSVAPGNLADSLRLFTQPEDLVGANQYTTAG
jgi:hypothetical protein